MARKKIFMIFHGRMPSEKASALFAVEEAQSFANLGVEVVLLVPRRLGRAKTSIGEYYSLTQNFRVVYLPTIDIFWVPFFKRFAFHVSFVVFSLFTLIYVLLYSTHKDSIYSNESLPILLATFFRVNTLYQVHDFPEKKFSFYKLVCTRVKHVLIITEWKQKELVERFSLPSEKIHLVRNGVHVEKYGGLPPVDKAREALGLPSGVPVVVYTGHLYGWKGVETLARALSSMPTVQGYFVGGTEGDVANYRSNFSSFANIHFVGHRPHVEMPLWQHASDVLVLPNTAHEKLSTHYTSPMKLFEYMASGRPIVASRIPSIEEVVSEREVFFAHPDDPISFARVIEETLSNSDKARKRAMSAHALASQYSWKSRAERILSFLFV